MKVLLCQSYLGPGTPEPLVFPIGLAYLASSLNDNYEVQVWDSNTSEDPVKDLSSILENFKPDIVGVSLRNIDSVICSSKRSYYVPFVSFIRMLKQKLPSCKLIVGGPGFSIFSKEIMKRNKEIDFGVVSEGELVFAQLLGHLDHPEHVKNLVFRKKGKLFFTERAELVDFDTLPPPSREKFNMKMYQNIQAAMGIQSKRGCSFGCIYCVHRFYMGTVCRLRSPKKVVDELEDLVNNYDLKSFYFVDPVFNYPLNHAREICLEINRRKLNIQWEAAFRPDFINARFMEEAVKAGCILFDFSPDGASNEAMRILGKNLRVEHVDRTISLARMVEGVTVAYEFLYDLPSGNAWNNLGLVRLFSKISVLNSTKLRYLLLSKMRIFPNTPLHKIALSQGKISEATDLLFPVHYESGGLTSFTNIFPRISRGSAISIQKLVKCFSEL